jgi:hypothetical protein
MIDWNAVKRSFEPDGSLRDIYVHNADAPAWEAAFAFLLSQGAILYYVNGVETAVPARAEDALSQAPDAAALLLVEREEIEYACHFFSRTRIELDFWPEAICDAATLAALERVVVGLGVATGRNVLVTHESMPDAVIMRYVAERGRVEVAG